MGEARGSASLTTTRFRPSAVKIEKYGRYQLIQLIATGGMAQIFLARMTGAEGFEKLVVIKRILPHLAENEEFIRMFLDEARIAARLNHPNVVQIFDLGFQDGTYFIAMEYIHGEDVRRVWKKAQKERQGFPVAMACRVVMDACAGLHYAHEKQDASGFPLGIIHRDISPQNILIGFEGGVKVVDFGIAKASNRLQVTRSGVIKGKYAYMSPEQAQGYSLDSRSDIFSLGVVLFELLTTKRLFRRSTDLQTLAAATECHVPVPSQINSEVSPALDAILLQSLAKDPDSRFQSALEFQVALENVLAEEYHASSSAHLAAFMRSLYSERLTREESEGQVLLDESRSESVKEPSLDEKATLEDGAPPPDQTTRLREPEKPIESPQNDLLHRIEDQVHPEEVDVVTPPAKIGHVGLLRTSQRQFIIGILAVGVGMIAAWIMLGFQNGNLEQLEGHAADSSAGLSKVFRQDVGAYRNEADASVNPIYLVNLKVTAIPDEATITVEGDVSGKGNLELEVPSNKQVRVRASCEGYKDGDEVVWVGSEPTQSVTIVLKPWPHKRTVILEQSPVANLGEVRFVVNPWANIECDGTFLGQTPFSPRKLAAGSYDCVFKHPSLGSKFKRIVVRANEKQTVTVKY